MKKALRIIRESFFALRTYRNPWVYFSERLYPAASGRVRLRLRNGIEYRLEAGTNQVRMVDEIWRLGVYDHLLSYIHAGSTVVDIGANVGVFSVKAARRAPNVRVISYEPFLGNFAVLKDNITVNHLEAAVTAVPKAVGGARGELELFFRPHDSGGVSLHRYGDVRELSSIRVPCVTLEDIFREHHIDRCDFLKMDCEGAEEAILLSAPRALFERIRGMTIEWHYDLNRMSIGEFCAFLEGLGYRTRYNAATLTLYAWRGTAEQDIRRRQPEHCHPRDVQTNGMPRISIICPVRNVERYIEQMIHTVLAQSHQNWEMLIMDGASTDGTPAIVRRYVATNPNIRLYSEPDEGPWEAIDKGLALARGEFLCVICGQDGFLDSDWLAKCINVFDTDTEVALVWGSTREMSEDGRLLGEKHVSYSHLMQRENFFYSVFYAARKVLQILSGIVFGGRTRRRFLLRKLFSRTARLRINFLTKRSFSGGTVPQKSEWFSYWLATGFVFPDQAMCVSKRVYLECAPRYPKGSRIMHHLTDFSFNFNRRGYLAWHLPSLATFGRIHPGSSGDVIPDELYEEAEGYLQKVLVLRKRILKDHEEMVFIDRDGKEVSRRRF